MIRVAAAIQRLHNAGDMQQGTCEPRATEGGGDEASKQRAHMPNARERWWRRRAASGELPAAVGDAFSACMLNMRVWMPHKSLQVVERRKCKLFMRSATASWSCCC